MLPLLPAKKDVSYEVEFLFANVPSSTFVIKYMLRRKFFLSEAKFFHMAD